MYEKSIELLNTAIADELAAIHQYMYFHFRLDDLGYAPLANLLKMTAIEEMQHAEMIAERILFLGGEVEMKVGREVEKIHDAEAMLKKARRTGAGRDPDVQPICQLSAPRTRTRGPRSSSRSWWPPRRATGTSSISSRNTSSVSANSTSPCRPSRAIRGQGEASVGALHEKNGGRRSARRRFRR